MGERKLVLIETGRGFAALAVLLLHVNEQVGATFGADYASRFFDWGERGVDFFFVLSGFVIAWTHERDVGHRAEVGRFAIKRMVRLYPLLWLVAIPWLALNAVVGHDPSAWQWATSITLIPMDAAPYPSTVWTLRHEALFYAWAGLMIAAPRLGAWVGALWLGGSLVQLIAVAFGGGVGGLGALIFSTYTLQFAMGVGVASLLRRRAPTQPLHWFGWGLVAAFALAIAIEVFGVGRNEADFYRAGAATGWALVSGLVLSLTVYGLAAASDRLFPPRWMVTLGAASYAIYLLHVPIIVMAGKGIGAMPDVLVRFGVAHMLLAAFAVSLAVLVHLKVEAPLLKALRAWFVPPRSRHEGFALGQGSITETPTGEGVRFAEPLRSNVR